MRLAILLVCVALTGASGNPGSRGGIRSARVLPHLAEPDTLVQRLVGEVNLDSIRATIQRLQDFGTREATTDSNLAAVQYAFDRFVAYDCDTVYLHHFDTVWGYGPSVVGVKRGRLHPEIEYIICGHIDSWGPHLDTAPGADDNASGTTAVLEAARVFAPHWFNYTVRFIGLNAEEAGMRGSVWYAYEARSRGDSILGVLNFDMIGYGPEGKDSVIVTGTTSRPDCRNLMAAFVFSARAYTPLKFRSRLAERESIPGDHEMFRANGYPALLIREVEQTPEYHRRGDTLGPHLYEHCGVNNLPMMTEVIRAGVATLATLAQVDGIAGIEETPSYERVTMSVGPTIVRGSLFLPRDIGAGHDRSALGQFESYPKPAARLLDASGRKVMDLQPGENDVRHLAPGVYFIRAEGIGARGQDARKLVIQR